MTTASPIPGGSGAGTALEWRLEAAIDSMIETLERTAGISSPRPCGTSVGTSAVPGIAPDTIVGVSFNGWTAAMRRDKLEWRLVVPGGPMPCGSEPTREWIGDVLAMQYAGLMLFQVQRHRLATAHGLGTYADERLSPNHFLVDRSTAILLAEHRIDAGSLVVWHRRNSRDDGDRRTVPSTGAYTSGRLTIPTVLIGTMPIDRPHADAALIAPTIAIGKPGGTAASVNNRQVAVGAVIPETVLVACAGKRLGDIVETGIRHLDDRHIETAHGTATSAKFLLEPQFEAIHRSRYAPPSRKRDRP